ncbi:MAG: hypothetical protein N2Z76_05720 [Treponemataceae bacterium]|nr:hypothetical protein [Treponemataceae bacterium]
MKFRIRRGKTAGVFLGLCVGVCVCSSCRKDTHPASAGSAEFQNSGKKGPALIVSPHERPYWFAFSPIKGSPAQIFSLVPSPEATEASPLVPWTTGVRITEIGGALFEESSLATGSEGMHGEARDTSPYTKELLTKEILLCPLNTWGLLVFQQEPQGETLWIFPIPFPFMGTESFTIGPLFPLGPHMAFSLYGDSFFQDLPPLSPQSTLWYYDEEKTELQSLSLEALVPNIQNLEAPLFEIESVTSGNDGLWYIRALSGKGQNAPRPFPREVRPFSQNKEEEKNVSLAKRIERCYFSLEQPGKGSAQPISVGTYYEKTMPQNSAQISPLIQRLVQALPYRPRGILRLFREATRSSVSYYLSPSGTSFDEADTYYWGYEGKKGGIIIDGQGKGAMLLIPEEKQCTTASFTMKTVSLPPLPPSFVYTGIGLLENWILASWEEQDAYLVGAAGILLLWYNRDDGNKK